MVNAIYYLVVGGVQWRMIPKEYPKWQSAYYYFRKWCKSGLWKRIHDTLRARVREKLSDTNIQLPDVSTVKVLKAPWFLEYADTMQENI